MRDPLEGLVCALSLVLVRMGVARTAQVRLLHGGWASGTVDAERPIEIVRRVQQQDRAHQLGLLRGRHETTARAARAATGAVSERNRRGAVEGR
eukprot:scaffold121056_cov75-Phaeocystis_antarctica.AAC.1